MFGFLSSWKFWLVLAVIIILIVWFACNFERKKPKRHVRSSREQLVSHEDLTLCDETSASFSGLSMSKSHAKPLDREWQAEVPHEILNDVRPESMRKMTTKETKGEKLCKEAAERIYGVTFHRSVWPNWLRNPETGHAMELDLYNEQLKIAIEYNGRQHYQYVPYFHKKGVSDFEAQVRRDHYKLDICDQNGVYVIIVPHYLREDKIEAWIRYYDPTAYALREARKQQLG
jgi:hypothetical protein